MYKRVLVPLDGSELAEGALEHGAAIAKCFGAVVCLLRVIPAKEELPVSVSETGQVVGKEAVKQHRVAEANRTLEADEYLTTVAERLRSQGVTAETEVRRGSAGSQILDAIPEQDIDLTVMCTHGRSGVARMAFGSVTDQVIRKSGRPVLAIRPPH